MTFSRVELLSSIKVDQFFGIRGTILSYPQIFYYGSSLSLGFARPVGEGKKQWARLLMNMSISMDKAD